MPSDFESGRQKAMEYMVAMLFLQLPEATRKAIVPAIKKSLTPVVKKSGSELEVSGFESYLDFLEAISHKS